MKWFESWEQLGTVAATAAIAYVGLIVFLRVSGKRTLSQLNAFDFVVTVAFGSTLATTVLSKGAVVAEGLVALGMLIPLQYIVAQLQTHFHWAERLVKAEPRLLFHRGAYLEGAMRAERIRREEVLQAVRSQGVGSLEQVEAVVLETNGNLSVLSKGGGGERSTLANVNGAEHQGRA